MIKVGIIGCGRMADQHAVQIRRIKDAEIAAVCDKELLMAKDMSNRFGIGQHFNDVHEMLRTVKLDVIHITTPPQSHYPLAKICLKAGCNVYVEKPFTLDACQAEELIELAESNNLKLTAGHNAQFTHAMIRMRELVQNGYLGGKPIHIESHYCYDFGDETYAKALLEDSNHWVRILPGSLLQNIISHGISKIVEFLSSDNPRVIAYGFTSNFLKNLGENEIIDEVRVIIQDEDSTTAYFTFSSQIKPVPHQLRLYGPQNSLIIDDDHQILIKIDDKDYKSYLRYFLPPFQYAKQYVANFSCNFKKFLKKDFHLPNDSALKTLIESFYHCIAHDAPLPLSYREILLTARIMDAIFEQVRKNSDLKG
jgi:predicted dehydrogenase